VPHPFGRFGGFFAHSFSLRIFRRRAIPLEPNAFHDFPAVSCVRISCRPSCLLSFFRAPTFRRRIQTNAVMFSPPLLMAIHLCLDRPFSRPLFALPRLLFCKLWPSYFFGRKSSQKLRCLFERRWCRIEEVGLSFFVFLLYGFFFFFFFFFFFREI